MFTKCSPTKYHLPCGTTLERSGKHWQLRFSSLYYVVNKHFCYPFSLGSVSLDCAMNTALSLMNDLKTKIRENQHEGDSEEVYA